VRYAFDYARTHGRKKVTVVVKDNIMKLTDGLFAKVFEEIGKREYPEITRDRVIVDIGAGEPAAVGVAVGRGWMRCGACGHRLPRWRNGSPPPRSTPTAH
jgi:hypothetical protein